MVMVTLKKGMLYTTCLDKQHMTEVLFHWLGICAACHIE